MKKIFSLVALSLLAVGLLTRCEDSIDFQPKDVLETELQLSKIATYEQLINSAYDRMQAFGYLSQYAMLGPDALTDNAVLVNNTGRYVGELTNQAYAHFNYWFLYPAINDCNIIIDKIDTTYTSAANVTRARVVLSQAYFLRSMIYFDLMKVYAYEPTNIQNGWDKGVILRDKPVFDVAQADLRSRSTIEECYSFIEDGLLTAIDSMSKPGTVIPNQPFRANLATAHGILAKLYMHWGRNADALAQIDNAIATKPAATRLATAGEYIGMWSTGPTSGRVESLFELRINVGSTGSNGDWSSVDGVNNSLHSLTTTGISPSSQFVLAGSESLIAAYETGDVRRNLFTDVNVRGRTYNMNLKWPGSAGSGFWADNIPVLRMSDLILMRAEAAFKENDEALARTAVNDIRTRRGLAAIDASITGSNLFNLILNERRVEFAFEGQRWFDLKRNGLNISKNTGDPLLFSDFRILAPLPLNQITLNPALEQNPGY